jgi:hypothetical protein
MTGLYSKKPSRLYEEEKSDGLKKTESQSDKIAGQKWRLKAFGVERGGGGCNL